MRLNEIVRMPSGRLALITEVTERQVYLTYQDDGDVVNFKRATFDQLWGAKKITHHAHKQNHSATEGVQPFGSGRVKQRAQLHLTA